MLGAVLLAVVAAGVAVALIRSAGDDAADRRAVVAAVRELVRVSETGAASRSDVLCLQLTPGTRARLDGLLQIASVDQDRRGCGFALDGPKWRLRPLTVDRKRTDERTWRVTVDGDRAVVDRGGAARLHLVRIDGSWKADFEQDAAWSHRVRLADACTRAGRSAAEMAPPRATLAGLRGYYRDNARILEILAKRVARERPPAGFRGIDARIVSSSRSAARRYRAAARKASGEPFRLFRTAIRVTDQTRVELGSQLPQAVARTFRRAVGVCYLDSGVVVDPPGIERFDRQCARALSPLIGFGEISSLAELQRFLTTAVDGFGRVGRGVRRIQLSPAQDRVARAVRARLSQVRRAYAEIGRDLARLKVPDQRLDREIALSLLSASFGLQQLGATCGEQTTESAPKGAIA